jgi:hypothetical protein
MSNHYHLLLETPEANLADGMGWLQEQKLLALAGSKLKDRRKRRALPLPSASASRCLRPPRRTPAHFHFPRSDR